MDKDFMLNYYDKMVRPIWTELMKMSGCPGRCQASESGG